MSAFVSSALLDGDGAESRRWWFSAMLAVGLHAAIAAAALIWHTTSKPLDPSASSAVGPFLVDLAPPPAAWSPEQSLPQPQAGRDSSAVSLERSTEEASAANRDGSAEPAGLQRSDIETRANGLVAEAPIAPVPPDNAARDSGGGGAAASNAFAPGHAEGHAAVGHAVSMDPGPIDTSITALPSLWRRKAFSAFDQNRMILLRPSRYPGYARPALNPRAPTNAPNGLSLIGSPDRTSPTYSPGAHIQDRVNAAIERQNLTRIERARNGGAVPGTNSLGMKSGTSGSVHDNPKNAIGAITGKNGNGSAESGVLNGTTRNAVGMTMQVHSAPRGINIEEHREGIAGLKGSEGTTGLKTVTSAGNAGLRAATSPPGILNGRGVARSGTSLTALGGAPKTVPGSLSGSDFHAKHQQ